MFPGVDFELDRLFWRLDDEHTRRTGKEIPLIHKKKKTKVSHQSSLPDYGIQIEWKKVLRQAASNKPNQ